jgi:hypothetical protein
MAVIDGGVSTSMAEVGVGSASGLHTINKPTAVGALGHYKTSHRAALVNTQAANSFLFEFQNAHASNICVIHSIRITIQQTAAHTAAIEDSIDCYRLTSHSAVATTNTVTPTISKLRTSFGTAGVNVRGVTVAGAAAGMTGGTRTKDAASPLFQVPIWLLAAVPTAGPTVLAQYNWVPNIASGEHPLVLVQNEGFIIENRVLLGAAAGSMFYVDIEWAEVTAF